MKNWLKENFKWLGWILGVIWTAIAFWAGNYISYVNMKAEVKTLSETVDMILKTNEMIQQQLIVIISKL